MRIIFMPYVLCLTLVSGLGLWNRLNLIRKIAFAVNTAIGVALLALMFYWFKFIVNALLKTICGRKDKKDRKREDDKAERIIDNETGEESRVVHEDRNLLIQEVN